MDRASMKAHAKEQIKGKILTILAITIIIGTINFGVSFILGPVGSIATFIISGAFTLAEAFIFLGITKKSRMPKIEDIFVGFKGDNFLRSLVAYLRYTIFTFLWGLLFVIPGIIKSIAYSQMFYLLAEDDKLEAGDAQRKSMEMMEGHKMDYFILGLSFIPWYLLCIITLGIASIYVAPYIQTTMAEFHVRLLKENEPKAAKVKEAKTVEKATKKPAAKKSTKKTTKK